MLITGNLSNNDYYNLTEYVNATIDIGTVSTSDDLTIMLYDDGAHEDGSADDKVFSNIFQIPNNVNKYTG